MYMHIVSQLVEFHEKMFHWFRRFWVLAGHFQLLDQARDERTNLAEMLLSRSHTNSNTYLLLQPIQLLQYESSNTPCSLLGSTFEVRQAAPVCAGLREVQDFQKNIREG